MYVEQAVLSAIDVAKKVAKHWSEYPAFQTWWNWSENYSADMPPSVILDASGAALDAVVGLDSLMSSKGFAAAHAAYFAAKAAAYAAEGDEELVGSFCQRALLYAVIANGTHGGLEEGEGKM